MEKFKRMQEKLAELCERMQAINDTAENENRTALTADEDKRFSELHKEAESLRMRLRESRSQSLMLEQDKPFNEEREYIPYVHRMSEHRAATGKRFREIIRNKGEFTLELRETVTATTTANASNAIPVYIKDFIEPLDKGLIYDKLGINIEYGLSGDIKYPIMPYIEATIEDEAVKLVDTTLAPGAINPHPRRMGVTCPLTGLTNIQTDMRIYNWILSAISSAIARLLNRWMFMPVAIKSNVFGVFAYNKTSNPVQTVSFEGELPTYKELLAMRGKVMGSGAYQDGTYAYVMSSQMYTALESTPINPNGDRMIITAGKIGEVPVFVTEEIECTAKGIYNEKAQNVGFGRFSDCKVGQFGSLRLIVNPYTGDTSDVTRITVNTHWAVDCIRHNSFILGTVKQPAS